MNEILAIDITDGEITEPVDLATVKAWLKIDGTDDDTLLTSLIIACRQAIEAYTCCSLVAKDVVCKVWLDASCLNDQFELPHGPVRSITTVTQGENTITDYSKVDGQFVKVYGLSGLYILSYEVGYTTVPQALKTALLNEIAYRYQNRGDQAKELMIGSSYLCEAAVYLCQPYKRMIWL